MYQTKMPAAIIREQIQLRCDALGLNEAQADECRKIGLDAYWRDARSIAWCISRGVANARTFVPAIQSLLAGVL